MSDLASTDLKDIYEGEDYTGRYHDDAGHRIQRLIARIKFHKNDQVLDVGCGNGLLLPEIHKRIKHLDGVDFSKAFINEAKKRAEKYRVDPSKYNYYATDVIAFCRKKPGFYDKVFALDFTEHINDSEFKKIFTAIRSAMKPGGQLVIHTPNKDFLIERLKPADIKIKQQGHIGLRNPQAYAKLFEDLGFHKVQVIRLSHYVSVLKPMHSLSKLPVVGQTFQARLLIICEA